MKSMRLAAAALGVCVFALSTFAQVTTGTPAFGTFSNGPDVINIGSLNSHLDIPILNKAGRGMNFTYDLTYDSSVWYPVTAGSSHNWEPVGGWGWGGQVSGMSVSGFSFNASAYIMYSASVSGGVCGTNYTYSTITYNGFTYVEGSGTPHGFNASGTFTTWTAGSGPANPMGCPPAGPVPSTLQSVVATDGSGLTLYWLPSPFAYVVQKNGVKITPPLYSTSGTVSSSTYMNQDLNGNYISGSGGVYTDTAGNTALTTTTNSTAHTVTLSFANTSGTTSSYVINYSSYNIKTSFECTSPAIGEYTASGVYLPSSVTLPDGTSTYSFSYEATPSYSGYTTGRIASVTLPTGNTITYAYTGGSNGITCADGSTAGLTRTLNADADSAAQTWTYTRSDPNGAGTSHTEVVDGLGNHLEYDFVPVSTGTAANYYETHRKVYNGAASGTPELERYTCYNGSASSCTTTAVSSPVSQVDTYETLDGAETHGSTVKLDTTYGNETEAKTYDFSTSATSHGTLLRDEIWTYGGSVPSLPTADKVYDGSSNLIGETTYAYDQTTPTASSGVPHHNTPSSTPGNLTTETVYASSSQSYAMTATYEDTGSLLTSVTPNGTTTLSYDSTFVYNTGTALPTPSSGVALSSTATFDTTHYTGLPLKSTDPNSQVTQVGLYDTSLRPTVIGFPGNGTTVIYYNPYASGTPLQTQQLVYQSSSVYTNTVTQYDGYGRQSRVEVTNGQSSNSFYQNDTCYDANGNASFQSNPYQSWGFGASKVCTSTSGTTTTYDVLGRVTQVEQANGETRSYSYTARAVKSTDENGVIRISQIDGLGRPTFVCEISSVSQGGVSPSSCGTDIAGTGFVTSYAYTPSAGTTTVSQGVQSRSFTSDWLGRPTSVTEPESGTTTYSYAYNSTGLQVTRKRPQANQTNPSTLTTTTTQYDALGRVVTIAYSDLTPTKTYAYDATAGISGFTQTNLKGRLSIAYDSASGYTSRTGFSYDGAGRVINLDECTPSQCATPTYRLLTYTYDDAGNMLSSTDGNGVTSTYTVSRANELATLTSSRTGTYNPSAIISSMQNGIYGPSTYSLGNGLTAVSTYDSLGRVAGGWVCSGSSEPNCTGGSGPYGFTSSWKGVRQLGGCDTVLNQCLGYGYDDFNRLNARTVTTGTPQNYTYSYDRYGNRLTQTPLDGGYTFNATINPATNQLTNTGLNYDAAGNMTNDGSHSYAYDAEGRILLVDSGGSTAQYIYDALGHRVREVLGSTANEFAFNAAGQRVAEWSGGTGSPDNTFVQGKYYWGAKPVAYYDSTYTYFEHQDWMGTERARTTYNGGVEGTFTSLPFGDGLTTASGADNDANHYGMLDHDYETDTEHAQFRQYNSAQGHWLSPDPYSGSYDFSNPQSLNRYVYVANSPLAGTDPSGLQVACQPSSRPGGGCTLPPGAANGLPSWSGAGAFEIMDMQATLISNASTLNWATPTTIWAQNADGSWSPISTGPGGQGTFSYWAASTAFATFLTTGAPSGTAVSNAPNNGKQNPCGTSCHSPVRPKGYNPAPSKDVFNNCQKAGILSMMMGWMAGPWFEGAIGVAVWGGTNTVGTAATMGCINN